MIKEESLINTYYDKLLTSKTPTIVLASAFRDLFNRDLQKSEWSRIGKLVNIYGKWLVLESFIRASINTNFDTTSPWSYLSAICLNLSKDDKESLEELEKVRQLKEKTQNLLDELSKPTKKIKTRKRDYLT